MTAHCQEEIAERHGGALPDKDGWKRIVQAADDPDSWRIEVKL